MENKKKVLRTYPIEMLVKQKAKKVERIIFVKAKISKLKEKAKALNIKIIALEDNIHSDEAYGIPSMNHHISMMNKGAVKIQEFLVEGISHRLSVYLDEEGKEWKEPKELV